MLTRDHEDDRDRRRIATAKRQLKIVKFIDLLLHELKADESEGGPGNLTSKLIRKGHMYFGARNPLLWRPSCFSEFGPKLLKLRELALEPHEYAEDQIPKMRRRKNIDYEGWDPLIYVAVQIFRDRGLPPTANFIGKRGYGSPLLRGLEKLHGALPAGVQASSASALGSPTAEWIKKSNRKKKALKAVV